jgi:hypothetical protein
VTGNCRQEAEQLVATADRAEKATFDPERGEGGCYPRRGLELSAGTVNRGPDNTATNLEKTVQFAQCMRVNSMTDLPDPTADGPLIDTSRLPIAAGKGNRSIPGFQAAADKCTAIYSNALGRRGQ